MTTAAISPAMPPVRVSSCTTSSLFVLLHRRENRFAVERQQRAQVDHLGLDAFFRQFRRGFERRVHHGRVADDRQVAPSRRTAAFPIGTV